MSGFSGHDRRADAPDESAPEDGSRSAGLFARNPGLANLLRPDERRAFEVYRRFEERRAAGEAVRFEDLLAEHPDLRVALTQIPRGAARLEQHQRRVRGARRRLPYLMLAAAVLVGAVTMIGLLPGRVVDGVDDPRVASLLRTLAVAENLQAAGETREIAALAQAVRSDFGSPLARTFGAASRWLRRDPPPLDPAAALYTSDLADPQALAALDRSDLSAAEQQLLAMWQTRTRVQIAAFDLDAGGVPVSPATLSLFAQRLDISTGELAEPSALRETAIDPPYFDLPIGAYRIVAIEKASGRPTGRFAEAQVWCLPGAQLRQVLFLRRTDSAAMCGFPAGSFAYGCPPQERNPPFGSYLMYATQQVVAVEAFWLDRQEVSIGQYERFLADLDQHRDLWFPIAVGGVPSHLDLGRRFPADVDRDSSVGQVGFEAAALFANWAGKRLPTDREWEYAFTTSERLADRPSAMSDGRAEWVSDVLCLPLRANPAVVVPYACQEQDSIAWLLRFCRGPVLQGDVQPTRPYARSLALSPRNAGIRCARSTQESLEMIEQVHSR